MDEAVHNFDSDKLNRKSCRGPSACYASAAPAFAWELDVLGRRKRPGQRDAIKLYCASALLRRAWQGFLGTGRLKATTNMCSGQRNKARTAGPRFQAFYAKTARHTLPRVRAREENIASSAVSCARASYGRWKFLNLTTPVPLGTQPGTRMFKEKPKGKPG